MTAPRRCFLDSNVLLRTVAVQRPDYDLVANLMKQSGTHGLEFGCSLQNLAEFWNVCTRPESANGFGMSLSDADRYLQVVRNTVRVLSETSETPAIWHDLVCRYSVRGAQVHDARIVAVMLSHRVHSIITMNTADFARYREVEAIHPGDRERLETI